MGADSARAEDTQAWMRRAREDLRAGRTMLDAKPPLLGPAAFHSQQAAEKALKAFLTWHDAPFRRTHDLGELGRQCTGLMTPWKKPVGERTSSPFTHGYSGIQATPTGLRRGRLWKGSSSPARSMRRFSPASRKRRVLEPCGAAGGHPLSSVERGPTEERGSVMGGLGRTPERACSICFHRLELSARVLLQSGGI